jgi:hypothetical protein
MKLIANDGVSISSGVTSRTSHQKVPKHFVGLTS